MHVDSQSTSLYPRLSAVHPNLAFMPDDPIVSHIAAGCLQNKGLSGSQLKCCGELKTSHQRRFIHTCPLVRQGQSIRWERPQLKFSSQRRVPG